MSTTPSKLDPFAIGTSVATIPMGLRILAIVLRALFIGALVAVTVRVSSPQSESLASVYETPGDLIRLALGFAVCLWIVIHLFMLPRTAEGYRTWVYLGLVVAPLALAAAIAIWRCAPANLTVRKRRTALTRAGGLHETARLYRGTRQRGGSVAANRG
jgi:hypothetical protein